MAFWLYPINFIFWHFPKEKKTSVEKNLITVYDPNFHPTAPQTQPHPGTSCSSAVGFSAKYSAPHTHILRSVAECLRAIVIDLLICYCGPTMLAYYAHICTLEFRAACTRVCVCGAASLYLSRCVLEREREMTGERERRTGLASS